MGNFIALTLTEASSDAIPFGLSATLTVALIESLSLRSQDVTSISLAHLITFAFYSEFMSRPFVDQVMFPKFLCSPAKKLA